MAPVIRQVSIPGGATGFVSSREDALRAQHLSWSAFPWIEGMARYVVLPGVPMDGSLITAAVEASGYPLPTYTVGEAARFFLHRPRNGRQWILRAIDRCGGIPDPGHPFHVPAPTPSARIWTLADVERMIRLLAEHRVIDYDQMVSSLQMVLWTSKGHRLHA